MPFRKMTRMPSQEVETLQEGAVLLDSYNAATMHAARECSSAATMTPGHQTYMSDCGSSVVGSESESTRD
jgi:hypothetical protein